MFGKVRILLALAYLLPFAAQAGTPPDLNTLSQSGYIMGPGSTQYPVHGGWKNLASVMKSVDVFDSIVDRIEEVACQSDASANKSVLLIGDSSLAYKYIFARLANRPTTKCQGMWHVDINVSKVEAGHKYVGEVDQYWQDHILRPSGGKDVIMYLQSAGSLIGIGSHSNDDTGIEREYVANYTSGVMRTVAYSDKYEYNDIIRSKHSYVLESYAEKIILPPMDAAQTAILARAYLNVIYPHLELADSDLAYLIKNIAFYQPNRMEPDRTVSVLNQMARNAPNGGSARPIEFKEVIESKHPYDNNSAATFEISKPEVSSLQLVFSEFDTEAGYDNLEVYDAKTNVLLETLSGTKGAFSTAFYSTNKLKLVLKSDSSGQKNGFKITQINGKKVEKYIFKREDVRKAILTIAQVPAWLMTRDYTVVRELQGKLDGDVVGVAEGKRDLVRLAKNGFVAGRTDEKPVATTLFTGPTGTGKSYIAKKMAEFMGMRLITMDMTSYKDPSTFRAFQDTLANHLTNTPYAFYLFEEIDKASIEVLDQLYFMMDEGIFYDKHQRPLFARGAFIMMTTNAASDTIVNNPNAPNLRDLVMADLQKMFRMSFLNRFDAISIFKPFTDAEFAQLAKTLINKKLALTKEFFTWSGSVDQGTYDYVARVGRSPVFGARPMERLVENVLGTGIADYQIARAVIPDEAVLAWTKLQGTHDFRISVNRDTMNYTIAPNGTFIGARSNQDILLQKMFEANRMY